VGAAVVVTELPLHPAATHASTQPSTNRSLWCTTASPAWCSPISGLPELGAGGACAPLASLENLCAEQGALPDVVEAEPPDRVRRMPKSTHSSHTEGLE